MFKTNYKITFAETDPGGIVFFAEFLKIAHVAYERFFDSLQLDRNYFLDEEYILPIVHTSADYFSPVRFGDEILCEVSVGKIGETSFELNYSLKNNDTISVKVTTKHVAVSKKKFEKLQIPDNLKNRLIENQL